MNIWDLVSLDRLPRDVGPSEVDPFTVSDALLESQVMSVHIDALRSRVSVLLEFRTAFNFGDESDTAVLWADGMSEAAWVTADATHRRFAWGVGGSSSQEASAGLEIRLQCFRSAEFHAIAQRWWFAVGTVPGLERIPDYTAASDEQVIARTPQWTSDFVVLGGSSWPPPSTFEA